MSVQIRQLKDKITGTEFVPVTHWEAISNKPDLTGHYKGLFNASTGNISGGNTTLTSIAEEIGDMYVVGTAGTYAEEALKVGDSIIFTSAVAADTAPTTANFIINKGTTELPSNNVTGSGTSGYIAKWNGTNTITAGPKITSGGTGYLKKDGTWENPIPSDNVIGSGLTSGTIILGNGNSAIKTSSKIITTTTPDSNSGDDTIPTSQAVYNAIGNNAVTSITAGTGLSGGTITSTGTISHATVSTTSSTSSDSPTSGGSFTAIGAIETNNGHVTSITTKTINLPTDPDVKVKQSSSSTNDTYPLLASASTNPNGTAQEAIYDSGLKVNPNKHSVMEGSETTASGNNSHAEGNGGSGLAVVEFTPAELTQAQKTALQAAYGLDFDYIDVDENLEDPIPYTIFSDEDCTQKVAEMVYTKYVSVDVFGYAFKLKNSVELSGTYYAKRVTGASGSASHAEGNYTIASGPASHVEGESTTASGYASHAEGNFTVAPGSDSHVEGTYTIASSDNSHAEGYHTTASGYASHAEGTSTVASGYTSHAEGNNTIALNEAEHAEGKYNISISEQTIHTVGIGNSSVRKNAHLITTEGKHYIPGVGGYDGTLTNLSEVTDLAAYINGLVAASDAMVFKGTIGTTSGATISALPAEHNAGWTYKVVTANTYAGKICEVGDMIVCIKDATTASNDDWAVIQNNVEGPLYKGGNSFTNNHVLVANGTYGLVKDSGYTIGANVPAGAVFTDTNDKVTLTVSDSGYTDYRPMIAGAIYSSSTTPTFSTNITGTEVALDKVIVKPNTGDLHLYNTSGNSPKMYFNSGSITAGGSIHYDATEECMKFTFA